MADTMYYDIEQYKLITQTSHLTEPDIFSLRNDCFCN